MLWRNLNLIGWWNLLAEKSQVLVIVTIKYLSLVPPNLPISKRKNTLIFFEEATSYYQNVWGCHLRTEESKNRPRFTNTNKAACIIYDKRTVSVEERHWILLTNGKWHDQKMGRNSVRNFLPWRFQVSIDIRVIIAEGVCIIKLYASMHETPSWNPDISLAKPDQLYSCSQN